MLNEKALISSPKADPKYNEDINPCDSKFTVEGLEMLSTSCNLRLVQAENTLQGTGKSCLMLLCPICFNHFNQTLILRERERETIFSFIMQVSCSLCSIYKSLLGKMVEISQRFIMRYDYTASSEQNHNLF